MQLNGSQWFIIAAVILVSPTTVSALENDRRFYLTPGITYNFLDKDQDIDNGAGYQIAIGKPLSRHFNLELQLTTWESDDDDASGEFDAAGLNLLYLLKRDTLSPYGLLGVMGTDYDLTTNGTTNDESGVAYDLGIGLIQDVARHGTALRWEYRYRLNQAESDDFNDHVISLSLQVPLGAPPEIPAPPPAPEPIKPVAEPKPKAPPPPPEPKPPRPAIVLEGVHFDFDSAKLKPEAQNILSNAAVTLKNYPEIRAIAIGHTCNIGTEEYNDQLSLARAQSVKDFLVSRGVAAERLLVRGYGERLPVADNSTIEGRKRNRRVEISVINEKLCLPPKQGEATDADGCAIIE